MSLLLLGCLVKDPNARSPIYPDKSLKEIIIGGSYRAENPKEVEELKKELLRRPICTKENRDRGERCGLWEGETFEDRLKNRPYVGKERFIYTEQLFCYNQMKEDKPILNKNLRARLYDKEGNLITEDFLRIDGPIDRKSQGVISYIPYNEEGVSIRIVRLKGKKEIILKKLGMFSESKLKKESTIFVGGCCNWNWEFDEKKECHVSPPTR